MADRKSGSEKMTGETTHVRRLTRHKQGKMIKGVAAGLGDYFGTDPVWFRLGFVLSAFLGGAGIIAYLVLFLILPEDDSKNPTVFEQNAERVAYSLRGTPAWIGVALVVIGGLLAVSQVADWRPGVFWGLALIALGIAFFRRHTEQEAQATAATAVVDAPSVAASTTETKTPLPEVAREAPSSPRARRERSGLGFLTIGSVMVALGTAALLDMSNALHITLVQYLALALSILGLGMLTGTFLGRARWLIVPSILLLPFVLTASLIHVPFKGGSGDHFYRPIRVAEVHRTYHIVAGQLVVDLREITKASEPIAIDATAVAGRILIHVPDDVNLTVRGRVGAGEVQLFGTRYDGVRVDVTRTYAFGASKDRLPVVLNLETSLGKVEVTRGGEVEVTK